MLLQTSGTSMSRLNWKKVRNVVQHENSQEFCGVLPCKGIIHNSSLPYSAKCPILITRKQNFTKQVIKQSHENVNHHGAGETLANVRAQFWITKGRQAVKYRHSKCVTCKKIQRRAYSSPPTPILLSFWVSDDLACFSCWCRLCRTFVCEEHLPVHKRDV